MFNLLLSVIGFGLKRSSSGQYLQKLKDRCL